MVNTTLIAIQVCRLYETAWLFHIFLKFYQLPAVVAITGVLFKITLEQPVVSSVVTMGAGTENVV